jgi:uncharacterized protein YciI
MIFAFFLKDRPGVAQLRTEIRPIHKEYLAKMADQIAFAGPLTADDGVQMIGSLLVMDFPNRAAALAWIENEPFTKAGVYEVPEVHAFTNLWPQKVGFPV